MGKVPISQTSDKQGSTGLQQTSEQCNKVLDKSAG